MNKGSKKSKKAQQPSTPPAEDQAPVAPPPADDQAPVVTPPQEEKPKASPKAKSYTVARGSVQLGRGDVRRAGASIFADELRPQDIRRFLRDGTLSEK